MNRLSMPISTIQTYITGIPIEIAEIVLKSWPIKRQFIALITVQRRLCGFRRLHSPLAANRRLSVHPFSKAFTVRLNNGF